jgi:hypothetical protein
MHPSSMGKWTKIIPKKNQKKKKKRNFNILIFGGINLNFQKNNEVGLG